MLQRFLSLSFAFVFVLTNLLLAQKPTLYPDGRGSKILFPIAEISFADEVVSFNQGNPSPKEEHRTHKGILNVPDYETIQSSTYTTLGCGGEIVLKFNDNVLVDVNGPDLFVFEIGPAIEATQVYISKDGTNWIDVGTLSKGKADIDISDRVNKTDVFQYVKLVDLKEDCPGQYPGADIDAVGVIGSIVRISLNSSVLFDTGKYELKDSEELTELAGKLKTIKATITIEGHTDSDGSDESNLVLSQNRAEAVKSFLISNGVSEEKIVAEGFGEKDPIATNETEEGKQMNRRVEIMVNTGGDINYDKDVAGTWKTNRGKLHLYQIGQEIIGWYNNDDGEVYGTLINSNTFEGKWVEGSSSKACDSEFMESKAWGRIKISFNDDFSELDIKWNYCDEEPTKGAWSGNKIK